MPLFSNSSSTVFFIHIPKCGGTSIENYLKDLTGNIMLFDRVPCGLPCTPQHFDRKIIKSLFSESHDVNYFTVVRHPVMRMISEYFHNTRRSSQEIDFNVWVSSKINQYGRNSYVSDNHIKPQVFFIMPKTKIFKFESGLDKSLMYATKKLNMIYNGFEIHEKNWKKKDILIDKDTVKKIQDFYSMDMSYFEYVDIDFEGDSINYSVLKNIVEKGKDEIDIDPGSDVFNIEFGESKAALGEGSLINVIRDIALENEASHSDISRDLFSLALKYRPKGKAILQKLVEMKAR